MLIDSVAGCLSGASTGSVGPRQLTDVDHILVEGGNEPILEVRLRYMDRTYSGFSTAHRRLGGVAETLVAFFCFVGDDPAPHHQTCWIDDRELQVIDVLDS